MARISKTAKRDVRELLLRTGAKHFARDGFERTNINRVAIDAGFAKGTIYNYFASKDALFVEVIRLACQRTVDRYEASPHGRSVREQLVAIVEADVSVFREEEDFIKVLVREALSFRGETYGVIVQGLAPFLDAVQQILAGGQRAGAVRTDRPLWQLALLFVGNLSLLYTQYWGSAGAWPTLEELPELAASAFLDGASRPNTPD